MHNSGFPRERDTSLLLIYFFRKDKIIFIHFGGFATHRGAVSNKVPEPNSSRSGKRKSEVTSKTLGELKNLNRDMSLGE
jgi:hypothetical protein